jgi:hypothetical protein
MKQQLLLWVFALTLSSCGTPKNTLSLDAIFSGHFEHKMISSGPNFPDFYSKKDSLDLFLVALHEGVPVKQFQKRLAWVDTTTNNNIAFLESKNWLAQNDGLKPTIFIASNAQGEGLFSYGTPIALEIAHAIEEELYVIKIAYEKMAMSKSQSFDDLAFFILSDVLLDNWQINNVEREFLMTDQRPERHGKNYYYAIMENTTHPREEFGIYGNQYRSLNDSTALAIYGNNRNEATKRLTTDSEFKVSLLQTAAKLSKSDNEILKSMANNFKPELLRILAKNSEYMHAVYEKTGYAKEISFEEFFIWWYHFIYTDVTNMLAEKELLQLPEDGNFYYIVEQ